MVNAIIDLRNPSRLPITRINLTCRVKYEQNIGDLRRLVCKKANIELSQLQLFWHGKELLADDYDEKTLLEMDLHTGFSLMAYDLSETPDYWPPVEQTPAGLQVAHAK